MAATSFDWKLENQSVPDRDGILGVELFHQFLGFLVDGLGKLHPQHNDQIAGGPVTLFDTLSLQTETTPAAAAGGNG